MLTSTDIFRQLDRICRQVPKRGGGGGVERSLTLPLLAISTTLETHVIFVLNNTINCQIGLIN